MPVPNGSANGHTPRPSVSVPVSHETIDAAAIFAPLWRRKWLILLVGILVAAGTYAYYKHRPSVYGASTQLYLGGNAELESLIGAGGAAASQTSRELADQAELINSNVIGEAVQRTLRQKHELLAAQGSATATAASETDFITLTTKAGSPQGAAVLANTYAQVYLAERVANYRRQVKEVLTNTEEQLHNAEASRPKASATRSPEVQALAERIDELKSELNVTNYGDRQINPAVPNPVALSPSPERNAIFGFAIGVLLAAIAAYGLSRADRRLRTLAEVEQAFELPILCALPSTRHPIAVREGVPAAAGAVREPLRRLHTTLQLQDLLSHGSKSSPRSVLFLSAEAGAGKSTLIAGLALVQREAGERVAVVDADLRRSVQPRLLRVNTSPGLTEVLAGELSLEGALQEVAGPSGPATGNGVAGSAAPSGPATGNGVAGSAGTVAAVVKVNGASGPATGNPAAGLASTAGAVVEVHEAGGPATGNPAAGSAGTVGAVVEVHAASALCVLASGAQTGNPPALLAGPAMAELLRAAAGRFDHVLIDAPPPLEVSDVMPLLHAVDAVVIVARVRHTRKAAAARLLQLLERSGGAPVLGVAVNDVPRGDIEAYGLSSGLSEKR
jgi:Mrp family chromosome partitioning ATPase/capsular polysaccharide biosynthesis protein